MTTTLVLPHSVATAIAQAACLENETAGVIIASLVRSPQGDLRLLARDLKWVPDDAYLARGCDHLSIASHGYVPALAEAEQLNALAIWFHTHPGPGAQPTPSLADHKVDREISDLFRLRANTPYYGTLIVSPREDALVFTGTLYPDNGEPVCIDRLWCVGDSWRLYKTFHSEKEEIAPIFDRSVRAFGPAIQKMLGDLRIGLVGCGGTGSAVAEQLVRLGVRHLQLVDADRLTASNITRVYGSDPSKIGMFKTDILRQHLMAIAPDLDCVVHASMVTLEATARQLSDCDVVFGCTDDNAGRLVLARFSTYFATPVVDLGILLSSNEDSQLKGIDGRVTIMAPGEACLVCRGRIDLARAAVELRTPEERRRLADEGYAPALAGIEPAVVSFTTAIAAAGVNEFLERLIGFGPSPRPSEVLFRWHEREVSTNTAHPKAGHYCDPAAGKIGTGDRTPFLEQAWPGQ